MEELEKNKNKRKVYISLLVSVICIIAVSYAFFTLILRQSENNNVTALSCFSTTLTEENSAINLTNEYPVPDETGLKKTPFTFKLTNNCDNYVKVYITIDSLKEGTTDYILSKYMKGNVSHKDTTDGKSLIIGNQPTKVLENKNNGYILLEENLSPNEVKEYDLRLWINYDTTKEQAAGMTYTGQVVIVTEPGEDTSFAGTVLRNNEVKTPLTTPGVEVSTSSEALLASTEDDYGTSYYFRGAVTNNYVEFANKCWRIVRIGGDNTIKLILHNDNTSNASNPCSSANNSKTAAYAHYNGSTYTSKFNTGYNDNAYVGFMYRLSMSSTYEETHANEQKSTILTNLETWYNNNLKTYESVIDDNVFCTDKTNVTNTAYNPLNYSNVTGLGYNKNVTYYGATQRLVSSSNTAGGTGPSLKCNGDLSKITSKIGLITADELVYAGYAAQSSFSKSYLQENATGYIWCSLSPHSFSGSKANVWAVNGSQNYFAYDGVSSSYAVRAYISIKSSVEASSGYGTSEDPYVIN